MGLDEWREGGRAEPCASPPAALGAFCLGFPRVAFALPGPEPGGGSPSGSQAGRAPGPGRWEAAGASLGEGIPGALRLWQDCPEWQLGQPGLREGLWCLSPAEASGALGLGCVEGATHRVGRREHPPPPPCPGGRASRVWLLSTSRCDDVTEGLKSQLYDLILIHLDLRAHVAGGYHIGQGRGGCCRGRLLSAWKGQPPGSAAQDDGVAAGHLPLR